jgi:NAD(P)H dehydrogenase (quinone)
MILVTGAGGKTGKALIHRLSRVESVCAFVYREELVPVVRSLGAAKVVIGDLRDEAAVRLAMEGVRAIYHICPNMNPDEVLIGKVVTRWAEQVRVEHFVYHSVLHPQTEKMPHHWQKLRVEELILESGMPFTILQPAPYMQNMLTGMQSILEESVLRVPYSVQAKFSFVDLEDVTEAAKIVLTEPGDRHGIYELAGISPMSHVEVAKTVGDVLKRDVRAEQSEPPARTKAKDDPYTVKTLLKMFDYYDRWGLAGNPDVLRWILKREPTSVEAFFQRALEEYNAIP